MGKKAHFALKLLLAGTVLAACRPSQAELDSKATEIAARIFTTQTAEAPTPTFIPTRTPTQTTTATVTPMPTYTPTRTRTPSPSPVSTSAPGDVLFSDDFSGNASNWSLADDTDVRIAQSDDVLSLSIKTPNIFWWTALGADYEDVTIDVDAMMVAGPLENAFGVMCRVTQNRNYQFYISSDGFYGIWLWVRGEFTTLHDWTRTSAIKAGTGQVNHITATCLGDQFSLRVNGQHLTTVSDDTYASGDIALYAATYDQAGVTIEFDNLVLTYPLEDATVAQQPTPVVAVPIATSSAVPTPAATSTVASEGEGQVTFTNSVTFHVQFILWAGDQITIDLAPGQTRSLSLPVGEYGWTSFIPHNGCQLLPSDNLAIEPATPVTITVIPSESECEATLG